MALQPQTTFAWWLHAFRHEGESERSFADRMGIDQRTLRRIYKGNVVHQSTYIAIATALDMSPGEVFNRAASSQPDSGINKPHNLIAMIVDGLMGLPEVDLVDILRHTLNLLTKRKPE